MLNDAYTTPYGYSSINNVSDKYELSNYSFHFEDAPLYSTPSAAYENNVTNTTLEITFILPVWRQVLWTLLFVCMVIVATVGNLVVIWIVLANKRMRTVTNYFLADAMVSTLNVTFNYTYMLNLDWPFGNLYCKISQFVAILSICASVFTLMAISIDRSAQTAVKTFVYSIESDLDPPQIRPKQSEVRSADFFRSNPIGFHLSK
ncbi:hypothetical protein RP20_CCG021705 [Aedes albopictus]|nr:hypothetical protein RP20_CCG021705 [Aedes albopictus]